MAQPDELHGEDAATPRHLPRHTTPTWEVELLISGVAVFAMLQLPSWLDDAFFALEPRLSLSWAESLRLMYFYAKSAALILATTFVIHLLLRARWIALVGMDSVYPDGIRWDRLRIGPVQRQIEQQRYHGTAAAIERADNRATTVFAVGVMLASLMLLVSVLVGAAFVVTQLLVSLLGLELDIGRTLALSSTVVVLPLLLSRQLDRAYGSRLRPGSLLHRILAAILRIHAWLGLGTTSNSTMALLSSHGGERRVVMLAAAIMAAAIWIVILGYGALREPSQLGNYGLFPSLQPGASRTLDPMHYADLRNPARDGAVPYIQGVTVTQPYLRLVLPYQPKWDDAALRRYCPAILALTEAERPAATLDCLQQLHPVSLDGEPVAALQYDLSSDPRTDRPALLAMIDVRSLAPGRHELLVARPPATDKPDISIPYRIPFWR